MTDRQFLVLNERWALAHDDKQWILQKRGSHDGRTGKWNWQGVAFIASSKKTLLAALNDHGVDIRPAALEALSAPPNTFADWHRGVVASSSPF